MVVEDKNVVVHMSNNPRSLIQPTQFGIFLIVVEMPPRRNQLAVVLFVLPSIATLITSHTVHSSLSLFLLSDGGSDYDYHIHLVALYAYLPTHML